MWFNPRTSDLIDPVSLPNPNRNQAYLWAFEFSFSCLHTAIVITSIDTATCNTVNFTGTPFTPLFEKELSCVCVTAIVGIGIRFSVDETFKVLI